MVQKRVLGVIGLGHVGAHVAYALAIQGIADELVLVDQNEQKLASEVQDLRDAVAYLPHRVTVRAGDFADLGACDVIVNSVGKIELLRGTHDRVTEMDFTIPAVRGYAEKLKASGFDGVLINITNPCDIVTRELALHVGLPKGRVFGTGTGLDTSRLLSALARQTGIDHKSITCYMMGEHGNQQFAPWSCVSFRGMPLDTWAARDERFRFDRDALQKESIGGGWVTFSGKFCTEYGIATTAARMAYAVLHDEKVILPASAELTGEYGEGMDYTLRGHTNKLLGIVNGIDYSVFNPKTDKTLIKNYDINSLANKEECKKKILEYFGLKYNPERPLIALISRLVDQKGLDLIRQVENDLRNLEADFIFLGSGDKSYENLFIWLSNNTPNIRTYVGYRGDLANQIYAGSDFFLMPSRFEPCGLSQLIAMRFGSLPIVRATGGLEDTVTGYPLDNSNGFKFWGYDGWAMKDAILTAMGVYRDKYTLNAMRKSAMEADFSWKESAKKYLEMYRSLV